MLITASSTSIMASHKLALSDALIAKKKTPRDFLAEERKGEKRMGEGRSGAGRILTVSPQLSLVD